MASDRDLSDMEHPDSLRYGPEHEWSILGADGLVTVGITDFAQDQLGDVEFLMLPEVGATVRKGDAFIEVESTKTSSEVYAPCSGVVSETHDELVQHPEQINAHPYESWLVRIRPSQVEELEDLRDSATYVEDL